MASGRSARRSSRPAAPLTALGLGVALAAAAAVSATLRADRTPPVEAGPVTPLPAVQVLRDGDLVFRRGRDLMAGIVLAQDDRARFSHVGMLLIDDGRPMVVHATPGEGQGPSGVLRESLQAFAAAELAAEVAVFRAPNLTPAAGAALRRYLEAQVGKPFDLGFVYSDDTTMYCTELVLKALRAGGVDLAPRLATVSAPTLREPAYSPDGLRRDAMLSEIRDQP
ncbi:MULTISPECIES: YiiX/YebB-like N1pC/P60 family cysteine hydrolase [unclassified Rubrivivax]|uniref:YiiX/YebB-like N1pC/P60 family cysteine hydrolase n=1 Tax=unclassified Rubrivivax TaxID=2649762 RepID=UPI001E3F041F|nr:MULTISPECIES: YiiX/YebB-like N1pC/P60 family cysteine hydrolase [unclassified Rubrivivax]MCC9595536.1 hypothetical protein [Rubrivivax sp. JA1055]MCC9646957.1 hypothetical protein [Rubrivivax sp. JA1029]